MEWVLSIIGFGIFVALCQIKKELRGYRIDQRNNAKLLTDSLAQISGELRDLNQQVDEFII